MFSGEDHEKNALYDRHVALGAKLIDFGGWAMPVQYTGVVEEHHATRTKAGCSISVIWVKLMSEALRPLIFCNG